MDLGEEAADTTHHVGHADVAFVAVVFLVTDVLHLGAVSVLALGRCDGGVAAVRLRTSRPGMAQMFASSGAASLGSGNAAASAVTVVGSSVRPPSA
jgi:hypothetical protein